ncbi:MAG: TlpA disulfide reductase family protein [Acidobacteriota bacterium]
MIAALSVFILAAISNLTPINQEQLAAIIEQQQGQVVLVNFWATWCIPCREEFPDLVRLYEEQRGRGLTVISISLDEVKNEGAAQAFLERQQAVFPAYRVETDSLKRFLQAMDPAWTGAIPATFIFDRQGRKSYHHIGLLSYEEMAEEVESAK